MPKNRTNSPRKKFVMPQAGAGLDLSTAILRALEDSRYDWRTVSGLARSTGVTEREVKKVLDAMRNQLVSATADDGRILYTTRSHYEKTHGIRDKILSALADRVVA
jgi:hypothetical protein